MTALKHIVQRSFPATYEWLRFRFGHPARMARIAAVVDRATAEGVVAGPFRGMKLAKTVTGSYIPKRLGTYESELHRVIETAIARNYSTVIDVGAGEGYYAVGMALRLPNAKIFTFDTDERARVACAAQSRLNGVADRISIGAACSVDTLAQLPLEQALLIMDCEGYEATLLSEQTLPLLASCDVLVELHELFSPGITERIVRLFADSHEVVLISSTGRDPDALTALAKLKPADRVRALDEARYGPMQWAWISHKESSLKTGICGVSCSRR